MENEESDLSWLWEEMTINKLKKSTASIARREGKVDAPPTLQGPPGSSPYSLKQWFQRTLVLVPTPFLPSRRSHFLLVCPLSSWRNRPGEAVVSPPIPKETTIQLPPPGLYFRGKQLNCNSGLASPGALSTQPLCLADGGVWSFKDVARLLQHCSVGTRSGACSAIIQARNWTGNKWFFLEGQ